MVIQACKYGMGCYARSCKFSHPSPGSVGSSNPDHSKCRDADSFCPYTVRCYRARCELAHPSPALWGKGKDEKAEATGTRDKRPLSDSEQGKSSAKSGDPSSSSSSSTTSQGIENKSKAETSDEAQAKRPKQTRADVSSNPDAILVTVSTYQGHELALYVMPDETIMELKQRIQDETGLECNRQRLVLRDTEISNNTNGQPNTLQSSGIANGASLHIGRQVYTEHAGQNRIETQKDRHGNALGSEFDLGYDGAFSGCTVGVLHFYTAEGFDFKNPEQTLKKKGFDVIRWANNPPGVREFEEKLQKCNQLWVISGMAALLSKEHLDAIERFFLSGRGVYVWGDNDPYYADANAICQRLFRCSMNGNVPGAKHVGITNDPARPGILPHMVSTGIERIFEGVTVATVKPSDGMTPLIVGSGKNLITTVYEHSGRRAIIDGAFTRLYINWDDAGTARYVINAACWLANHERFGEAIFQA